MFVLKWSRFGAVTILGALGVQNLVLGTAAELPPCDYPTGLTLARSSAP